MGLWDDPDLRQDNTYVNFENVGDELHGTVHHGRKKTLTDPTTKQARPVPCFDITTDDGNELTWTIGQQQLRAKLAEANLDDGDHVDVRYREKERREGGKTLKHFDVRVTKAQKPNGAWADEPRQQAPQQGQARGPQQPYGGQQPQQGQPYGGPTQQGPYGQQPAGYGQQQPPAEDPWATPTNPGGQQQAGFGGFGDSEPPF